MREAKAQRRRMRKRTGAQELTAGAEADLGAEDVPHRPNSQSNNRWGAMWEDEVEVVAARIWPALSEEESPCKQRPGTCGQV